MPPGCLTLLAALLGLLALCAGALGAPRAQEVPASAEAEAVGEVPARGEPARQRLGGRLWRLAGSQLVGTIDGPLEIDSVEVQHESMHIRALKGRWLPELQVIELQGQVVIRDTSRVLYAERGLYYRQSEKLELEENVRGEGPEGRFYADRLFHDRRGETLTLRGAVRLLEADRRLECAWLHYNLADSIATAGDEVLVRDQVDSIEVRGRYLTYDRAAALMWVVGNESFRPRMEQGFGPEGASLRVTADTLEMGTDERIGAASGGVTLTYEGAEGFCERARFLLPEDRILLTGAPVMQDAEGWISGDSMVVGLRGGAAERLSVWGHACSEYSPADRPQERHFAVGDSLTAFLEEGAIRSVLLEGHAEALYLPSPEDRTQGVGYNWTRGRRLRLVFGESGVERIQFEGGTEGRYATPYTGAPRGAAPAPLPASAESDTTEAASADAAHGTMQGSAEIDTARTRTPAARTRRPSEGAYSPAALNAIRQLARDGSLEPSDSLLAWLPFDPGETVHYAGEQIDFAVATEKMLISGEGSVTYRDMELRSEEIVFYAPRNLVVARGEPELSDRNSKIVGTEMTYRIDRHQGLICQGRSQLGTGYYIGERIKRVTAESFFVEEGRFTTCSDDSAHFHFRTPKMKVIPGEKVVARPVVLYLGHIPIMAVPYAVFPTRRGRQSGILIPDVEVGLDTSRGRFLKNVGYYWAPNDYIDMLGWLDYYEEDPRTTYSLKTRYRLRYVLSGQAEASFTRQENYLGGRADRWLIRLAHDQMLGERTSLKISGNFQSDKDYGGDRDFGASVDERINQVLRSQVSFSKSWSAASLSLYADRTEYLSDPEDCSNRISQSIPSVTFSLNSFPLGVRADERGHGGRLGFLASTYVRGDLKYRSIYSKNWCGERETNQASGLNVRLSDKRRLLGAINLTPSATISAAWVHEDPDGGRHRTGVSWRAGFSAGTTLYGTLSPHLGAWEALRHVVELSAAYSYRPELEDLEGFPSVGGISLRSSKASSVSLRATQRFHLKWRSEDGGGKKENVLVWSTSTAYDFLAEEKASDPAQAQPWSNISHSFRLQPGRFLDSNLSITHDPERWRDDYRLSLRTNVRLSGGGVAGGATAAGTGRTADAGAGTLPPGSEGHGDFGDPAGGIDPGPGGVTALSSLTGPWHMTLTHVLSKSAGAEENSSANLSLGLSLTPAWRVQYGLYYDISDEAVTSQGYTLSRDLHCWQAVFERRTSGGRSSYYFRISIKDLPDIKYERRRL
ncbi:MAG: LPS-assembly protein LptD [Candidatus Eisenbacteria sp.]|nr:LPS-assembly protein LptD [Candidatus Eisenbacteria bacterium]